MLITQIHILKRNVCTCIFVLKYLIGHSTWICTPYILARLKPIDPFVHATAQLGDTFYYAIRPEDSVETIITKGKATVTQHILNRLLSNIHSSQQSNSQVSVV